MNSNPTTDWHNGTTSSTEPIQYIERNGVPVTLNNRSLKVLRDAGMQPTRVENVTGNLKFEGDLDKHLKGSNPSLDIKVRSGKGNTTP